jgi:CBS domain-containing protein
VDDFRDAVKRTLVRDADRFLNIEPCLIPPEMSLIDLATRICQRPDARVIAVVDQEGRLIGLVRSRVLFEDIYYQIMPEEFVTDATTIDKIVAFARLASARIARDLMQPPVSVTMDQTVRDAFELMHDNTLAGLPIVDRDRKVIGYLDMLEMLLVVLEHSRGTEGDGPKVESGGRSDEERSGGDGSL